MEFKGTLDYIFYSSSTIGVNGVLKANEESDLARDVALPSPFAGSDHIPLLSFFHWK